MGPVPGTGAPRAAGAGVAGSARQSGTSMPQLVPPMLAAPGSLPDDGDWVVVHVGFAIAVVDEEEARQTLALLRELDELQAGAGLAGGQPEGRP